MSSPSVAGGGMFNAWLAGTSNASPAALHQGNYISGGSVDGQENGILLPSDPIPSGLLSDPAVWDIFHSSPSSEGVVPATTVVDGQRLDDVPLNDSPFWLETFAGRIEDLDANGNEDGPDSLSLLSGRVKQTSNLALDSWQLLRGMHFQL